MKFTMQSIVFALSGVSIEALNITENYRNHIHWQLICVMSITKTLRGTVEHYYFSISLICSLSIHSLTYHMKVTARHMKHKHRPSITLMGNAKHTPHAGLILIHQSCRILRVWILTKNTYLPSVPWQAWTLVAAREVCLWDVGGNGTWTEAGDPHSPSSG